MYRIKLIIVVTVLCSISCYSQDDNWEVDRVTQEICSLLSNDNEQANATKEEIDEIFYGTILKHQDLWNPQMESLFPDSEQDARNSAYYLIIDHKLLLNCPLFSEYDEIIDKTFKSNELKRRQYFFVKKFIVEAQNQVNNRALVNRFNDALKGEKLDAEVIKFKTELLNYKKPSMLNIINAGNKFIVSIYDYKSGNDYLRVEIGFKDTFQLRFDSWLVQYKYELDLEQKAWDERQLDEDSQLEIDFNDIMSIPPTDPPSDKND